MLRTRQALTGLGVLLVLAALGLPWASESVQRIPGFITPSTCIPTADGTMWCSPGFISAGFVVGGGPVAGAEVSARVFLVAALVLVAVAVHRSSARALTVAAGTVLAGVFVTGPALLAGPVCAVVGAVLLARAARLPADGTTAAPARPGRAGLRARS